MKRAYVLAEGQTDVQFLRRILPPQELDGVELVDARGKSALISLARSLLAMRRAPVAILMDSDSLNPDLIEEQRQGAEDLMRFANASVPSKVVTAVPEIEAWFFASPQLIERMTGSQLPADWISLGKRDPKGILEHLAKTGHRTWDTDRAIAELDEQDVQRIRAIPEVAELSAFLQAAHASS